MAGGNTAGAVSSELPSNWSLVLTRIELERIMAAWSRFWWPEEASALLMVAASLGRDFVSGAENTSSSCSSSSGWLREKI